MLLLFCGNFIAASQNGMCLYTSLTKMGHTRYRTTDGVLGDLNQGFTELLDSLRCDHTESDEPKHNIPEVF